MTPAYIAKLGLIIQKTDVCAMVIAEFSVQDKFGKVQFFEETFLLADTSTEVVLEMFFLTFSNADVIKLHVTRVFHSR